ncbi:MAG TPA: OmpA family protein [Chitinophagaceae bacterium]|nr:OmpA family protein [Chitinophagaceae bacterium]
MRISFIFLLAFAVLNVAAQNQPYFTTKYDFVPGDKLMVVEDFTRVNIGDFPAGWNTNATAEVVTVKDQNGKWLKITKTGVFHPEMIQEVPDNMTLEFHLIAGNREHPKPFAVNILSLADYSDFKFFDAQSLAPRGKRHGVQLKLWPGHRVNNKAATEVLAGKTIRYDVQNKVNFLTWHNVTNSRAHVAMWRQGTRLRVYVNGEKVWDLPKAFDAGTKYNAITFAMPAGIKGDEYYLLGHIRMAVGAPDTRAKWQQQGKFATNGILFDSGSDRIKPESYGVLKEISTILHEDPNSKVKITGHTDSDGDDNNNLVLSKKRAAAVKDALVNFFGISADKFQTDGKGEKEPGEKGDTPKAKAANRRVVFEKL